MNYNKSSLSFQEKIRDFVRKTLVRENEKFREMHIETKDIMKGYIDAVLWTEEDNLKSQQEHDEESGKGRYAYDDEYDDVDDDEEETELDRLIRMQNTFKTKNIDVFTKEHIGADSLIQAYLDIKKFLDTASEDAIREAIETNGEERLGHDIWLTRNGHGAGFFDHTYDPENENSLIAAAQGLGYVDIYIDDNNMLRFSNEN